MKDWEYRVVKIRGFFQKGRIFVRKDRDGKKGYSVFAPFYTTDIDLDNNPMARMRSSQRLRIGTMVDLGWVPLEHVEEIKDSSDPLELIEWDTKEFKMLGTISDPITGFEYREYGDDESPPPLTDLTAIVRAGERWNPFVGSVNFPKRHLFQFIDLDLFSRIFQFPNQFGANEAYLQRFVEDIEEGSSLLIKRQMSRSTPFQPQEITSPLIITTQPS